MDKSDWGEGPWQHEPDKVEWVDKTTGLHCLIWRNTHGSLCGYVGVDKNHPAFGLHYDVSDYDMDGGTKWWRRHVTHRVDYKIEDIYVHGGLTFAGLLTRDLVIADGLHWFGFDCAHHMDYSPVLMAKEKALGDDAMTIGGVYRDINYVTKEVESLAKQLAAIKPEDV